MTTGLHRPCAGMPRPRKSTKRGIDFWGASAGEVPARCPANSKKRKESKTMKLHEAIKGMEVKSWERRESSDGKCTVYVRFVPKSPAPTVNVKEAA